MVNVKSVDLLAVLLQRCAGGDREAFTQLYQLSAPKLFALARTIVRSNAMAEDVLQESFFRIWHHAHTYCPDRGAALTWMTSIVRYRALDVVRQKNREILFDDVADAPLWLDDGLTPEDQCVETEERHTVLSCLTHLPAPQRHSLLLAYVYGFTHRELAEYLGVPLGTVKAWIRRGLHSIRSRLDQAI